MLGLPVTMRRWLISDDQNWRGGMGRRLRQQGFRVELLSCEAFGRLAAQIQHLFPLFHRCDLLMLNCSCPSVDQGLAIQWIIQLRDCKPDIRLLLIPDWAPKELQITLLNSGADAVQGRAAGIRECLARLRVLLRPMTEIY